MGDWVIWVILGLLAFLVFFEVVRDMRERPAKTAPVPPADHAVKTLAACLCDSNSKVMEMADRVAVFAAEGREGVVIRAQLDEMIRENAEHKAWRQIAAAARMVDPTGRPDMVNNEPPPMPPPPPAPDDI